eukprot:TRINITY_DN59039_c0_g1_i1.p3 TRINITY_DN59039_c0_g1~~TRINITY_DN59039_c0_g1_i1.p3  ORF type:complete len:159 (+),score=17.18 TRINITY_DN59039_c0_g1_i1:1506-1982(+)
MHNFVVLGQKVVSFPKLDKMPDPVEHPYGRDHTSLLIAAVAIAWMAVVESKDYQHHKVETLAVDLINNNGVNGRPNILTSYLFEVQQEVTYDIYSAWDDDFRHETILDRLEVIQLWYTGTDKAVREAFLFRPGRGFLDAMDAAGIALGYTIRSETPST